MVIFGSISGLGQIIYSGVQDINIPVNNDGVYLDVDTFSTSATILANADLNFTFGGVGFYNNATFQPVRTGTGLSDPIVNLAQGSLVSSATEFYSSGSGVSAPEGDGVSPHLGSDPGQFTVDEEGYLGFKFNPNDSSDTFYGWMRVTFDNEAPGGTIHDWAWDGSGGGINVGVIPEPKTYAFMLGLLGLAAVLILKVKSRAKHSKS